MCGIAGVIRFDGASVDRNLLKRMTDTLYHRGPDDEGYFINAPVAGIGAKWQGTQGRGNVGLGHRRLSIIDVSSGQQPMGSADGRIWIVFNGEIYNFRSLRAELRGKGHVFRTHSDTETILYAYREWGEGCAGRLRGMFAFAIWDQEREQLFLARDRVGKKPLYYSWDGDTLLFGSEIKAILAYPGVARDLDPQAVCDYFSLLYIPAPKSIFKSIKKVPAGHTALFRKDKCPSIRQYWDLRFQPDFSITEAEWCALIQEKLKECVGIRLESEVPLGAFLSGGIDSSAVVAMMSAVTGRPVKTSSIGFQEETFNELPFAHQIVKRYGSDHDERIVKADAVAVLDKLAWHYDEPFADSSAIPTYYVSKLTRERVTVALSGDGGDENFAGYRRYYFDLLENRLRSVFPQTLRRTAIAGVASMYPKADWLPRVLRGKTLLTNLSSSPIQAYFNSMSWFGADKKGILSHDLRRELNEYSSLEIFERYGKEAGTDDPLSRVQYIDVKTYLAEDILAKVDRASMANSLEVRAPLLDHEFMELAARIPPHMKLKGREGKFLFKKSLEPLLPHETLYRPKMGFSMPVKDWLRKDLKPIFEDHVFNSAALDYLDPPRVRGLWKGHQCGANDFSSELWAILSFCKWADSLGEKLYLRDSQREAICGT